MRKWKKRVMGCLLSAAVMVASTGTVFAGSTSTSGRIEGVDCYASLSCSITQATASVRCPYAENDFIRVRLEAWYQDQDGNWKADSQVSSSDRGELEVSATVRQSTYQYRYAYNYPTVIINGTSWGPTLYTNS